MNKLSRYICVVIAIALLPGQALAAVDDIQPPQQTEALTPLQQTEQQPEATPDQQPPLQTKAAGWYNSGGQWYYQLNSGANATGWLKVGSKWYYMNSNGVMATGWVKVGGKSYYLTASGAMATGWVLDKDKWYYLEGSGAMYIGWLQTHSGKYYLTPTGAMATGFCKLDGQTYYFNTASGALAIGWAQHDGSGGMPAGWYYTRGNGVVATGWLLDKGQKYYLRQTDGLMLANTTLAQFEFNSSGALNSTYAAGKVRNIDPSKPMVALTFDDGPSAYTQQILNILDRYNSRATFFMVGNRMKNNTTAAKQVVTQGSEIGTHAWNHAGLTSLSDAEIAKQLADSSNAIYNATGVRPTMLRPPYGSYNSHVSNICKNQGLLLVNWSVDPNDWKYLNADTVTNEILQHAKPGSIILCHDLYPSTVQAMERVVPALISKGYQLVTVSELLNYSGMYPGSVYNNKR